MLEEIGDVSARAEYVQGVKDRNTPDGLRHRVYKNMDPRAAVMRQTCYEVIKELKLEKTSVRVGDGAGTRRRWRSVFHRAQLYPNVDFYCIVLRAIGIPSNMFT